MSKIQIENKYTIYPENKKYRTKIAQGGKNKTTNILKTGRFDNINSAKAFSFAMPCLD